METMPNALVKDLLSTGYFYQELRNYNESKEIDLPSYSRNYAVPYLAKMLNEYEKTGQIDKAEILAVTIERLTDVHDEELTESIFGLKKMITSVIEINEKALHQLNQDDRTRLRACRRKSESAQTLAKLLVSIIKMFKLVESTTNRKAPQPAGDVIKDVNESAILST